MCAGDCLIGAELIPKRYLVLGRDLGQTSMRRVSLSMQMKGSWRRTSYRFPYWNVWRHLIISVDIESNLTHAKVPTASGLHFRALSYVIIIDIAEI